MRLGYGLLTVQHHPADPRTDADLYAEAVEYGVLSEEAGFDSIWTSEHHFVDDGYTPSQLPILAAIAARTQRIRLGTGVLLAPLFDPIHLAEDAAVVDLISRGRLLFGLGLGWRQEEFDGFGVSARERGTRLDGIITVLRQAWGDGLTTGDGRWYRYPEPGLNVTPKPVKGSRSPIWIGGGAEPALRRAGRIADGYLGSAATPEAMAQRVGWIRDEADRAGRDPEAIEIGVHRMTFASRDPDPWARVREAAHYMDWKYSDMRPATGSLERRPPPPIDAERDAQLRSRVIVGSPDEVADAIRAYEPALGSGGTFVFRGHFPGLDPAVQREALDVLAEEVAPLLRDAA